MTRSQSSRTQTSSDQVIQLDFRALYYSLRERAWLVLLCFVVAGSAAFAYLKRAPRIFESRVVLQVEQEEQKLLNIEQLQTENLQTLELMKTIEQTLQNRALIERVFDTLGLAKNKKFVDPTEQPPPSREDLIKRTENMVAVKLRRGTRLIDIQVDHTDAALTAAVGNGLVREFIRLNFEQNVAASEVANEFLSTEAKRLKLRLSLSENALQAYKEKTKSASLEERQNVVVDKLRELSQKVTAAKSVRIEKEAEYNQAQQLGTNALGLMVLAAVANDPTVSEIRSQMAKADSELATVKQRYKAKHPRYLQAASQVEEWSRALNKAILNVPNTIRSSFESARAAEMALDRALREQEAAAIDLNKLALEFNSLAREVSSDQALYDSVQKRIKETSVTRELKPSKVRIIQEASVPEKPVRPQPLKVICLALLAGLAGGVGLVFFLNTIDRSLKTVDEAESYLDLPVLATVPKLAGSNSTEQRRLIMAEETDSPEAEAFRTLRTSLSMLGKKDERRVFLFTSAVPAEGKTFCSMNYSASLAQQGLRTVVIDCDLRRPMVEKSLARSNHRGFGVTDFLTGQKPFDAVLFQTQIENLAYIPAGTHCPNPAELLAKTGIDGLIEEALLQFDRVIIDSPPIHAVSDTLLILNRVQTVCLVMKARRTARHGIRRAAQLLLEAEAPLAGVIMNQMPRSRGSGYYYDSYYSYSYHGYYSEKSKGGKKKKPEKPEKIAA
jgi:capsular exopolysaccharide synthesis family protein